MIRLHEVPRFPGPAPLGERDHPRSAGPPRKTPTLNIENRPTKTTGNPQRESGVPTQTQDASARSFGIAIVVEGRHLGSSQSRIRAGGVGPQFEAVGVSVASDTSMV